MQDCELASPGTIGYMAGSRIPGRHRIVGVHMAIHVQKWGRFKVLQAEDDDRLHSSWIPSGNGPRIGDQYQLDQMGEVCMATPGTTDFFSELLGARV